MSMTDNLRCVAGIDVGGSHTRCWIADEKGIILAHASSGPANRLFVSAASAQDAIEAALSGALSSLSSKIEKLVIAGPHMPPDSLDVIVRYVPKKAIIISNEFELALAAGLQETGGWGVVVAAGTGSFCKGRNSEGEEQYSGGWGPLVGDEGSGYDIAREALIAIVRASDGRGAETSITQAVCADINIGEISELKRYLYDPPVNRHELAALAKYVFDAAETGDAVAKEILHGTGIRLARVAEPVISSLFGPGQSFPLILTGGVMFRGGSLPGTFAREINKIRPHADVFVSPLQPVAGALIIGLDSIGVAIDSDIISNLIEGESEIRFSG